MSDPLRLIYEGMDKTLTWRGRPIWKNPVDLVVYQEIAHEVQPTIVIETGTHQGGSAEFWRDITGAHVVTVDTDQHCSWEDGDGIFSLHGSSTNAEILATIASHIKPSDRVLVNLDSLHDYAHVRAEINLYAGFVTKGSYLIVEDGSDDLRYGREGPRKAVLDWLPTHPEFIADAWRERTGITNCPMGFLKRIS